MMSTFRRLREQQAAAHAQVQKTAKKQAAPTEEPEGATPANEAPADGALANEAATNGHPADGAPADEAASPAPTPRRQRAAR